MQVTSMLAIYTLLWVLSAFVMLPLGIRTHDELGEEKIAGQADSAPANFRPGKVAVRATGLAAALFALFYLNYTLGWIGIDDILFFDPASAEHRTSDN